MAPLLWERHQKFHGGPAAPNEFTARQREVLRCVANGLRNREIAPALGISLSTVETHLKHVLLRLGASNRTESVLVEIRIGLLPSFRD